MENSLTAPPADNAGMLNLGVILGENLAFGLVAGRTSAAQAACLTKLREEKLYQRVELRWEDFCAKYLHISRAEADRTIHLWMEFGAPYFEMAQLTRISPEAYRAIAPSVYDGALHIDGETINLNPENSGKVAAAVAELRRQLVVKKPPRHLEPHERIEEMEQRATAVVLEFDELSRKERFGDNWLQFTHALSRVRAALDRIAQENGMK